MRQITKYQADKLIESKWTTSLSPVLEYHEQYYDVRGMSSREIVESLKLVMLLEMEGGLRAD